MHFSRFFSDKAYCKVDFKARNLVLADRGFTIEEMAGLYCAEVQVPPFTRGKKQLSQVKVDAAQHGHQQVELKWLVAG